MATTDTRPGFRLPWSTNGADADGIGGEPAQAAQATEAETPTAPVAEASATDAPPTDASTADTNAETGAPAADAESAPESAPLDPAPEPTMSPDPAPTVKAAPKKPSKFLADLTRAMQATAESSRNETMERFTAEAKTATERVHAVAADEATELRRVADEDVAGIRDWSKAEIARIREETENRISGRKGDLEHELEIHAGTVEARIERVSARVAAFEAEVADFYERLFAEEDPTRFAELAEQLPEPPSLEMAELDDEIMIGAPAKAVVAEPVEEPTVDVETGPAEPEVVAETATETVAEPEDATVAVAAEAPAEAPADAVAEPSPETGVDPRVAMLELTPDFEAAEAEAALSAETDAAAAVADEIPTIADEVLAARLAGLVPDENSGSNPIQTTKVVVTGLVSVASIAGFKRHLGRLQGVTTVGVSSGPDGEFVFSVHHLPTIDLAAGIQGLPGFESRITSQGEGAIEVAARDPEAHD